MTIDDLIRSLKSQRDSKAQEREDALSRIKATISTVNREQRNGFTNAERETVEFQRKKADALKTEIRELDTKIESAEESRLEDLEIEKLNARTYRTNVDRPAYDRVARIGIEARTYRQDEDPHGTNFLLDVRQPISMTTALSNA